MKKISAFITTSMITAVFATQGVFPAFAADTTGQGLIKTVTKLQNQASKSAERQQDSLQNIIHRADTLITTRLTSLNALLTRIQQDSKLSSDQKTAITTNIQSDISGLTSLKAKIDADTDAATAKADAKQIITNYYIFEKFEPKTRLLITLNNLQTEATNLQAIAQQLQNLINTFKSQGKDVSSLQSLLNDVNAQLQTITTTLKNDTTTIQNVSITTDSQATFTQVRQDLAQIVRSGFAKIRADFAQMKPLFHQIILPKPGSVSISVTGAPSSTGSASTSVTPK